MTERSEAAAERSPRRSGRAFESQLAGRACLVTGAASGIGRAIAVELARRGARSVAVCDLDDTAAADTVRLVEESGGSARAFCVDVADEGRVRKAIPRIAAALGGIDVLVNNAGIVDTQLTNETRLDRIPSDVWDRVFAVNVRGAWLCIKYAFPFLRDSRHPAIVNCASISSYVAFAGESSYCASKAAILLLTQSAALDFREFGIRCNCYCPGTVDTPLTEQIFAAGENREAERHGFSAMHLTATPRLAEPEEIARVVCFLASEDASFVNGAAVRVDGGALAWRGVSAEVVPPLVEL